MPEWDKQGSQMLLDMFSIPDLKVYLGRGLGNLTWQMLALQERLVWMVEIRKLNLSLSVSVNIALKTDLIQSMLQSRW